MTTNSTHGVCTGTRLSNVQPASLQWLWPGRIPLGKLTLLAGDPGLGKSFITLDWAARVTVGAVWPGMAISSADIPGEVVLLSAEDDLADTIRPRLDLAGARPQRIVAIDGVQFPGGGCGALSLQRDIAALDDALGHLERPRLVIIDPITAYLGQIDSHNNAEVRGVLRPLAELAARRHVAVVAVTHLNKSDGGRAVYRAMGSLAFTAAARAVWLVTRDPEDGARRLMLPVKMNLSAEPRGMGYRIVAGKVEWDDEPVDLHADAAIAALTSDRPLGMEDALAFLRQTLADGPMPAEEIAQQGLKQGYTQRTLERAKRSLGVLSKRVGWGPGGVWTWALPQHRDRLQPQLPMEMSKEAAQREQVAPANASA